MKGIECAFAGRLGRNAELRTSSAGREWLSLSIIVGEGDDEQWVQVASWSTTIAELAPMLVQGAQVYCEGKLKLRTWADRDGETRAGISVSASLIQPLALIGNRKPKRPRAPKAAKEAPPTQYRTGVMPQDYRPSKLPFDDDISYLGT